jgi:hypothetical protein
MRDKKRTFEVEVGRAEAPRARPAKPGPKNDTPAAAEEQKQEIQFSRELILRLIDWIKQI